MQSSQIFTYQNCVYSYTYDTVKKYIGSYLFGTRQLITNNQISSIRITFGFEIINYIDQLNKLFRNIEFNYNECSISLRFGENDFTQNDVHEFCHNFIDKVIKMRKQETLMKNTRKVNHYNQQPRQYNDFINNLLVREQPKYNFNGSSDNIFTQVNREQPKYNLDKVNDNFVNNLLNNQQPKYNFNDNFVNRELHKYYPDELINLFSENNENRFDLIGELKKIKPQQNNTQENIFDELDKLRTQQQKNDNVNSVIKTMTDLFFKMNLADVLSNYNNKKFNYHENFEKIITICENSEEILLKNYYNFDVYKKYSKGGKKVFINNITTIVDQQNNLVKYIFDIFIAILLNYLSGIDYNNIYSRENFSETEFNYCYFVYDCIINIIKYMGGEMDLNELVNETIMSFAKLFMSNTTSENIVNTPSTMDNINIGNLFNNVYEQVTNPEHKDSPINKLYESINNNNNIDVNNLLNSLFNVPRQDNEPEVEMPSETQVEMPSEPEVEMSSETSVNENNITEMLNNLVNSVMKSFNEQKNEIPEESNTFETENNNPMTQYRTLMTMEKFFPGSITKVANDENCYCGDCNKEKNE